MLSYEASNAASLKFGWNTTKVKRIKNFIIMVSTVGDITWAVYKLLRKTKKKTFVNT